MKKVKRIKGTRYWLDACMDVSGVYQGRSSTKPAGFIFTKIEVNEGSVCDYIVEGDMIRFALWKNFTMVSLS